MSDMNSGKIPQSKKEYVIDKNMKCYDSPKLPYNETLWRYLSDSYGDGIKEGFSANAEDKTATKSGANTLAYNMEVFTNEQLFLFDKNGDGKITSKEWTENDTIYEFLGLDPKKDKSLLKNAFKVIAGLDGDAKTISDKELMALYMYLDATNDGKIPTAKGKSHFDGNIKMTGENARKSLKALVKNNSKTGYGANRLGAYAGEIFDMTEGRSNTSFKDVDGVIGSSNQGGVGDCWLLSSINCLSYSSIGRSYIKDAITNNQDGTYEVRLNVRTNEIDENGNAVYEKISIPVTDEEIYSKMLLNATSYGDSDMKLLECAVRKLFDQIANDPEKYIKYDSKFLGYLMDRNELKADYPDDRIKSGGAGYRHVCSLFTGKDITESDASFNGSFEPEWRDVRFGEFMTKLDEIANATKIQEKEGSKQGFVGTLSFQETFTVVDKDKKERTLSRAHSYAVKSVKTDPDNPDRYIVTIVNPWTSNETIELFAYKNLSDINKPNNLFKQQADMHLYYAPIE